MTRRGLGFSIWMSVATLVLAGAAEAADIPIPSRVYLVKQDPKAGYVGKVAKLVSKPEIEGTTFPFPTADPTVVGATLLFYPLLIRADWTPIELPASGWKALGPGGSKGYRYRGAGKGDDPCRSVLLTEKRIKAVCRGPGSTQSPDDFSIPIGFGAAADLNVGSDRYCAVVGGSFTPTFTKNDGEKGIFKQVKSGTPPFCLVPVFPTPTPTPSPTPVPTPTSPYGSTSEAFVGAVGSLLP